MTEPMYAAPLEWLVEIECSIHDGWIWACRADDCYACVTGFPLSADARTDAVAHLATVHGIHPTAEIVGTEWGVRIYNRHTGQWMARGRPNEQEARHSYRRWAPTGAELIRRTVPVAAVSDWQVVEK